MSRLGVFCQWKRGCSALRMGTVVCVVMCVVHLKDEPKAVILPESKSTLLEKLLDEFFWRSHQDHMFGPSKP